MPKFSRALTEAYAVAPSHEAILDTLEISLSSGGALYYTNSFSGFTARLETGVDALFKPIPFTVTLPKASSDGLPVLTVSVDNINCEASNFITDAVANGQTIAVKYRPYLASDLSVPQMAVPMTFYAISSAISADKVVIQASFPDIVNKRFPNELYNLKLFPGLNG